MATATVYSAAPIFPTTDLGAMQAHYEALGFAVHVHQDGYATASRDGVKLHFRHEPDPAADSGVGAAYLAVDDADALHAEWVAAGVGETTDLFDPGFGVWEAAHTDLDGNLLRQTARRFFVGPAPMGAADVRECSRAGTHRN